MLYIGHGTRKQCNITYMKRKGTAALGIEENMVQKGRNIYANTNKHETGRAPHTDKPDGTYNMKF